MEKPLSAVATLVESSEGIKITVPAQKNYFVVGFLIFWLMLWTFGEWSGINQVCGFIGVTVSDPLALAFTIFWLAGWTFGGIFAFRILLWSLFGKEVISFTKTQCTIKRQRLLFIRRRAYDLNEAKNFRIGRAVSPMEMFYSRRTVLTTLRNNGTIWFDYGKRTIKFGAGIEKAEANVILDQLKERNILVRNNFTPQNLQAKTAVI